MTTILTYNHKCVYAHLKRVRTDGTLRGVFVVFLELLSCERRSPPSASTTPPL